MKAVNIFRSYKQEEDHFTNSLISVLSFSRFDGPEVVDSFLHKLMGLKPKGDIDKFRVLQGIEGTADGELSGADCCIRIESKIVSGTLRMEQILDHLKYLHDRPEGLKKLVLLTPDDSLSAYVREFLALAPDSVMQVSWKSVLDFLNDVIQGKPPNMFSELTHQFVDRIRDNVLNQDMAGIILKLDFGDKSAIYSDKYLDEMMKGEMTKWNTPREYKKLDGTGRKMLLYDRTRQAITLEVEIQKVSRTNSEPDYPWTNEFAPGTIRVFEPPISLSQLRLINGFENFGVYKKDRSPYRNLTHSQYRELTRENSNFLSATEFKPHSGADDNSDQFTLRDGYWYAAEFIDEQFAPEFRSYSPIRIHSMTVTNPNRQRFTLAFYHANYPEGVRDKEYTLQTIEWSRTFLLARSIEHSAARLLLVHPISWEWVTKHFRVDFQAECPNIQDWCSANY